MEASVDDILRNLGFLCLGSRLKRIGERLQADTQKIMDDAGVGIAPGQYPLLAALDRLGPLSVGDLAEALGVSQPGVTRSLSQLAALGLVHQQPIPGDQRRKVASLSTAGEQLVATAKAEIWPRIESAVIDLCGTFDGPLLSQLAAIEDGLAERPLSLRGSGASRPEDKP
ncbi:MULTISPECIES: MarR family winged helix-turn-helix transcriptional regulator [unclassified Rhizobium]|uniref:MarR family winged helix-turn-helix transcriptional regulator n=1 Tax=unclassified Rhizobium TaxID=2613769 RepID=UPI0007135CB4|nr:MULTISPECIES: MarR family transcriptional regulator [unclassified Rhizobium]KQS96387.1 MarR family transcriptional regulator [Rhizobium sp. Leaf386]KQT06226.1 MarR family transcriptional regulator [Rhizobium sp. Leaf391]KQU09539.1 MarR family transcriptional regulator [Rhizobium sp. Leaf453]